MTRLVGRSPWAAPWAARDALVPLPEVEAGASERARAPAPRGAANCAELSHVDTPSCAFVALTFYLPMYSVTTSFSSSIGKVPWLSTASWKSRISNFSPSFSSALVRNSRMVN